MAFRCAPLSTNKETKYTDPPQKLRYACKSFNGKPAIEYDSAECAILKFHLMNVADIFRLFNIQLCHPTA